MPIQTVCGPIEKEELGITSTHEHIFIDLTCFYTEKSLGAVQGATDKVAMNNLGILNRDPYALRDNLLLDNEELQLEELLRFKEAGGRSIVDATTVGIMRQPEKLRRTAQATGLNIIAGTGYYVGSTYALA